jgi:hypothetical protein
MKVTDITGGIREENIREQDLIIDPAKRTGPKPGFHSKAMVDHEVGMARSDCYNAAKHASEIFAQLRHVSETAGIPGWVASKITLAADYLNTVNDYLAGQSVQRDAGVVEDSDPCWDNYEQIGMKKKNGRQVPNCVPKKKK